MRHSGFSAAFGGDDRGTTAQETVEHHLATFGAVQDSVGDHGDRFHGRMQRQLVAFIGLRNTLGDGPIP